MSETCFFQLRRYKERDVYSIRAITCYLRLLRSEPGSLLSKRIKWSFAAINIEHLTVLSPSQLALALLIENWSVAVPMQITSEKMS